MYLKKLEIFGFKSFGNKATIVFDNKVTGIVGPNGSGKSNIVDAIRWVLGEQRPKSLRGGKMEDVIFSGTQEKRSLGYAFVSMTLDNSTGILPSDYSEVNISRRLYKSGESEYYINKQSVRLRDIQEMFMDTGLSREGYSIISQGKVESIVNNSPVERKKLIEEAVGIVKYKTRKDQAGRKLDKTQNNLYRIIDIISELEKRLPALKRNSKKARKYLELSEELKAIELNLFVHKADEYTEEIAKLKDDKDIMEHTFKVLTDNISSLDEKYQELKNLVSRYDEDINNASTELYDYMTSYDNSKIEIEVNKTNIKNINDNIENINTTIKELTTNKENLSTEKTEIISALEEQEKLVDDINKEYEKISKEVDRLKHLSDKTETAIDKENVNLRTKERMLKQNQTFLNESENRISNNDFIIETLKNDNIKLSEEIETLEEELENIDTSENEAILDKLDEENNILLEEKYKIEEKKADYKENLLEKYNNIKLLKGRKDLLTGYENNKDGYKYAIRRLFDYIKRDNNIRNDVYGTLGDLIKVKEKYMEAIQKSLSSTVEHVVVKDERTASIAINVLKKNKWGRITFLPHNIIKERYLRNPNEFANAAGFEGIASNLVSYDKKYENIIKNALGNVLIFDNLNNANMFAKNSGHRYKIATLDGEVLFPGGAMVGGKNKTNDSSVF